MKFTKDVLPYLLILISVIIIRSYIITPVVVSGESMNNTLSDGDLLLLKKYDKSYDRYDIIVFNYGGAKLVKRVIGLPGESIEYKDGKLYINNEEVSDEYSYLTRNFSLKSLGYDVIPDDYYFVLGDNRTRSSDSRIIGLINKKNIEGVTSFSLWPFKKI